MGVVRATRFSHTKWATWAGSWVTFCGLCRLRVKKSRGFGLGMAAPRTRRSVPKVGGATAPKHWTAPGCSGGANRQLASKSSPCIRPRGRPPRRRDHMNVYISIYPRSMVVKPSVKRPHYSECSVCPPIYIHVPPHTTRNLPFLPPAIKCPPKPSRTFPHAPPLPPSPAAHAYVYQQTGGS
jgi:hypothetical protein